jgi:hypothetical protein
LKPHTRYELTWVTGNERLTIGAFRTGRVVDTVAPIMPPSLPSVLVDLGSVLHTYKSDERRPLARRLRAWPQGLVRLDSVRDDLTPANELYYWAWRVGEEKSAFLLRRASVTRADSSALVLAVGDGQPPYECQTLFQFPFRGPSNRFVIALVAEDLAGNLSEIRHVVLDRRRQKRSAPKGFAY